MEKSSDLESEKYQHVRERILNSISKNRGLKGKRSFQEYPNHFSKAPVKYTEGLNGQPIASKPRLTFAQDINARIGQNREERPTALRSSIVERYVQTVTNKNRDRNYEQKLRIVKKMQELGMDNRVLNNMRQCMNEQIEDERGLMKIEEFRAMFFTAFGRIPETKKQTIYELLLPMI